MKTAYDIIVDQGAVCMVYDYDPETDFDGNAPRFLFGEIAISDNPWEENCYYAFQVEKDDEVVYELSVDDILSRFPELSETSDFREFLIAGMYIYSLEHIKI